MTRAAVIFAVLLAAAPGAAQAHKLKLFAGAEGATIAGIAYFAGGAPAMGLLGIAQAPDGAEIGRFATAEDGTFRLEARTRMDHRLKVDAGDGHMAETVVSATELPPSLPEGVGAAPRPAPLAAGSAAIPTDAMEAAVARQIMPLRRQLDAYEDRLRLHDILGGIGAILGVFGIVAWVNARGKPTP